MTLLDRADGEVVDSKRAGELGGVALPQGQARRRLPGRGRAAAKSAPLRVLSTQPAPPNTAVYDQEHPADGYGYLTTRDGTKLAIYVHPPPDVAERRCPASTCRRCPAGPRRRP